MLHLIPFIKTAGYIGIFAVIFSETGLLFGFFFPGDTLLFSAGLLASRGHFSIIALLFVATLAAILGDSLGYWVGKKFGQQLFTRKESFFFRPSYLLRADKFFAKHGKQTIVISRYVPIVRTFAPVLAGIAEMRYRTFFAYNIIGGALWCTSIGLAGYFLGTRIHNIDHYVFPVIAGVFVLSLVPVLGEIFVSRRATHSK